MAAPSVTHILTNGTAADATQINTNFNDIISGFSDGTKDFIMGSGDLSGNLVVDGNTTLGDASGDTLTVNATASFANNVTIGSDSTDTLTVNSTSTFANNVTIGSDSTDTLTVNSTSTFANNVTLGSSSDDTLTNNSVFKNDILMADGKGIDFSRFTDNSSAGTTISQILRDYEEGFWTPSDVSGASLSLTANYAYYIKIGRLVWITAQIKYPQTSSDLSGKIGGLPYRVAVTCLIPIVGGTFPNISIDTVGRPDPSYSTITISKTNSLLSQGLFQINGCYRSYPD